jgi:hypothetical protein
VLGVTLQAAPASDTGAAPSQSAAQTQAAQIAHDRLDAASDSIGGGSAVETAASDLSSTTIWIVVAVVAGVLLVGTWMLMRRRGRGLADAEASCTLNPQGAGC